jgi:hypothetical protein
MCSGREIVEKVLKKQASSQNEDYSNRAAHGCDDECITSTSMRPAVILSPFRMQLKRDDPGPQSAWEDVRQLNCCLPRKFSEGRWCHHPVLWQIGEDLPIVPLL